MPSPPPLRGLRPAVDLLSTSENDFSSWALATKPKALLAAVAEASVRRWALDRRTGARETAPEAEVEAGASYHSAIRSILSALLKCA